MFYRYPACLSRPPRQLQMLLLVLWLLVPSSSWARQTVLLVLSQQSAPYQKLVATIQQQLPAQHWQLQTVPVEQYTPSSVQADLIVTVGTQAASRVLQNQLKWPVLSVLIPRQSFIALSDRSELRALQQQKLLSAIYLEQPLGRQLQLAALIAPAVERLGVVLGPSSHDQQAAIVTAIEARGWQPEVARFRRNDNPIELLDPLAQRSDLLLVVPDRAEFNRSISKWLLLLSYRRNIPLIAFSRRYVEAGATAALFSSPLSIATDTVIWLERWRQSGSGPLPESGYPGQFDLQLNPKAAQNIGLTLPSVNEVRAALSGSDKP